MYHEKDWVGGCARPQRISKLSFGILSGQDVINASELEITNKALFVLPTRTPAVSGVLDRRMGTSRRGEMCETCGKITRLCPGHFGFIKLEMPCFHIGYFKHVVHILQCVCKTCARVLLSEEEQEVHRQRLKQCVTDSRATGDMFKTLCDKCKRVTTCPHCGASNGQVKKLTGTKSLKIVHDIYKKGKRSNGKAPFPVDRKEFMDNFRETARSRIKDLEVNLNNAQDDLTPLRALHLFEAIRDRDLRLLRMSTGSRPEWMIMTHIPVPPPCLRPSVYSDGGAGGSNEDDLTVGLQGIVNLNTALQQHIQKGASMKQIQDTFDGLQFCVAQYINSDLPGFPQTIKGGHEKQKRSLCQRLKGKAGRFRGNLSGKRVDFSARTVISPDPNLKITEVGVPLLIAKKLTYPEVVNRYNIERLREAVRNGFHIYPGANYFESAGCKRSLKYGNLNAHAKSLKYGDIVERHLIDGDVVLFNRQPSLHKQSIMAHTVRVLEGRTFRFNECVCAPYNADFDGDEMNLHVPQTEEARAEALELMGVMNNICTPKNGAPLVSATQDFITSTFLLTQQDVFMSRDEFCETITYAGDGLEHLDIPLPAICHPVQLWTGKQVISMLLCPSHASKIKLNFEMKERNYESKRKGNFAITQNSPYLCPNEGYTCFHNGELVCGNLTKSSLAGRGLFYFLERYYGPSAAAECMNRLTKMCTRWLTNRGFSIGIDDVTASSALTKKKQVLVKEGYSRCDQRIAEYKDGTLELKAGCNLDQSLESEMNKELSTIRDTAGQMCMRELPWHNSPRIMSVCGSKGSSLNICQMVAAVGQQTVNGSRAPDGFVNRSLPHFRVGAKHPAAKGFVANSFYTGLNAPEFFFHTMGGREGLVDTAVKTAKTGYMSRRLMKTLEDLSAQYDRTVRNSTSAVIQFRYGDDGLHPIMMESGVRPVNLDSLWDHMFNMCYSDSSHRSNWASDVKVKEESTNSSKAEPTNYLTPSQMLKIASSVLQNEFKSMFDDKTSMQEGNAGEMQDSIEYFDNRFVQDIWDFIKQKSRYLARLNDVYKIDNGLGSSKSKGKPLSHHQHRVPRSSFVKFLKRAIETFERSRVEPGEALGAVGAQSLGEPGTQMTLKTFHFAGVASMNVTLGVPRINELMNASKKTSTPIITAQLEDKVLLNGSVSSSAVGKDGTPILPPAFSKMAARMVKGRIEVTTLGEVSKHISENLSDQDYTVSVTLDQGTIEDLCLELTLEDVEIAIENEKRLQLKQKKCHQLIRQNDTDTLTIKLGMPDKKDKKEKDKDLFFEAQRVKKILCDIPVAGFRTISRAVVSVVESESESLQAKKRLAKEEISGRSLARVLREIHSAKDESLLDEDTEMEDGELHSPDATSDLSQNERYQLICEGRGLLSVMGTAGVDGTRTMSNDITEVNAVLGIEAARQSIQNEIGYVYSQYGLGIDPRHLMLLSDVMTYRGEILGINRFGIAKMKESVLMLASFEKTPDHLFDAAVHGAVDTIDGVSECIIMGTPIPLGTGMFKLRRDHNMSSSVPVESVDEKKQSVSPAPVPIMRRFAKMSL